MNELPLSVIFAWLPRLSERQRKCVESRHGLNGEMTSTRELAKQLKMTKSRVCQIYDSAIARIIDLKQIEDDPRNKQIRELTAALAAKEAECERLRERAAELELEVADLVSAADILSPPAKEQPT